MKSERMLDLISPPEKGLYGLTQLSSITNVLLQHSFHDRSNTCASRLLCVSDYSCALQRDILLQGRLYLSENWICFYSNIFRWETLVGLLTCRKCLHESPALVRFSECVTFFR